MPSQPLSSLISRQEQREQQSKAHHDFIRPCQLRYKFPLLVVFFADSPPYPDLPIHTASRDHLAVKTPRGTRYAVRMPGQLDDLISGGVVPYVAEVILPARGCNRCYGVCRYREDGFAMVREVLY